MHQTPRQTRNILSPSISPTTNPMSTNNPRDPARPRAHSTTSDTPGQESPRLGHNGDRGERGPSRESVKKLDQIIQNVFAKFATILLQERTRVTPVLVGSTQERKTSRWFQLDTDEIEDFRNELRVWKQCGGFENRPSPMVLETYLDTSRLKSGQSLVIMDPNGKRWDVVESMNSSDFASDSSSGRSGKANSQIILERWRVELKGSPPEDPEEFGPLLPTVYKKLIILFRSIYTTAGFLPAWKLARNGKSKGVHPAQQIRCRILSTDAPSSAGFDPLRSPLYEGRGDVSTDYVFGPVDCPVGRFYLSLSYRNNCNFQVVETESLLSSRIGIAISDDLFKPSLPRQRADSSATEIGSLTYHRHEGDITENQQRYGSLSTFHGEGPLGTSPISALKQVKAPGSDTTSPPESVPASFEPPPHSLPIAGPSRPSIRGADAIVRRPSVSFQPFKHGSLSGSPVPRMQDVDVTGPASPHSLSRGAGVSALTHARNRSSLTAGMPASLRGGPPLAAESPLVGSPRPAAASRFSSSFSHRRSRTSFGGTSRGEDDQISSGKQSLASSVAQPGSGLLNELGGGGSSGSFQTDDDNIQDFLKALESKRTLQSFDSSKKGESATRRTTAQLSKFHLMRESNNALSESLNSSMQLQRSSSSSSRQLTNVPGMSTSSSPGKPLSPNTPHTPAVPSRLSENSTADYTTPVATTLQPATGIPTSVPATLEGTTAIDIPLSPRRTIRPRRSSSVAQKHRAIIDDEEANTHRSMSLGAHDRETPSLSSLLGRHAATGDAAADSPTLQPPADIRVAESSEMLRQGSSSAEGESKPGGLFTAGLSSSPFGRRYGTSAGRGVSTPQSDNSSLTGPSSRFGRHFPRGGAVGLGTSGGPSDEPEEEPLLFDMSELGREQNRRSLEDGRGGGSVGSGGDRGGYESSRSARRW